MGRGKLAMELISNRKARLVTFEKRKKSLEKQANDLSTLCGVDICMIMYGPAHHDNESKEPIIWPRNLELFASMTQSYKSRSETDSRYKISTLSDFFKNQTQKIEKERQKLSKQMKETKYPTWNEAYDGLSSDEMKEFSNMLTARIDAVKDRINMIKGQSRIQENPVLMQHHQPLGCYDTQVRIGNQRSMMIMNNGASCNQSGTSYGNYGFCFNENQVQQQQSFGYYDAQPVEIQRNLAYNDALLGMEKQRMMNNNIGSSSSQSSSSYCNYGYSDENQILSCGAGSAPELGTSNAETLMCYNLLMEDFDQWYGF